MSGAVEMREHTHAAAPERVELVYRVVGNTHVFASKGIRGLVHIGHHDREVAFNSMIPALNMHVTHAYGCEAAYRCTMDYEQFSKHIGAEDDITGNFLTLTLDKAIEAH